ncbi:PIN domain-containing protein [uncultured Methylobacterium sp.]|uniref:PIN domain-containing protein n=1 Tax=uncultured Methylobacterium sp. TaxID=157278 RepID=UPI00342F3CCC
MLRGSRLAALLHLYGDRVLPIDGETARHNGRLGDVALARGLAPGPADLAIAATAQRHGWTVLTRNLRPLGVRAHDPFAALPDDTP